MFAIEDRLTSNHKLQEADLGDIMSNMDQKWVSLRGFLDSWSFSEAEIGVLVSGDEGLIESVGFGECDHADLFAFIEGLANVAPEYREVVRSALLHMHAYKISETYFGRIAVGNAELLPRLRRGKSITVGTFSKIEAFITADVKARAEKSAQKVVK